VIGDPALMKNMGPGAAVRFSFKAGKPGEYVVTSIEPIASRKPTSAASGHRGH